MYWDRRNPNEIVLKGNLRRRGGRWRLGARGPSETSRTHGTSRRSRGKRRRARS